MNQVSINTGMNRLEFSAAVVKQLKNHDISCVLVGGACVSIYTNEKYVSDDLDFISPFSHKIIAAALEKIGFVKKGRYFKHKNSGFMLNFLPALCLLVIGFR